MDEGPTAQSGSSQSSLALGLVSARILMLWVTVRALTQLLSPAPPRNRCEDALATTARGCCAQRALPRRSKKQPRGVLWSCWCSREHCNRRLTCLPLQHILAAPSSLSCQSSLPIGNFDWERGGDAALLAMSFLVVRIWPSSLHLRI
jgi:hypothetical protein